MWHHYNISASLNPLRQGYKGLDKGRILNCSPLDVSDSLWHIWWLWTIRTSVSVCTGISGTLLKMWIANGQESHVHTIPTGMSYNYSLAEKKKNKATLNCHLLCFPSLLLHVPVCRSVSEEPFLKLTTITAKHANDWYAVRGFLLTASGFGDALTHTGQAPFVHEHWIIRPQRQNSSWNNRTQLHFAGQVRLRKYQSRFEVLSVHQMWLAFVLQMT